MKEFYDLGIKELVNPDRMRNGLALYTPGQIEELKANIIVSVAKVGVIMSPDVLGAVVNEMVEHLVLQEYHYICDLFETVDYDGFEVFDENDKKIFEDTVTVKDTGVMARSESLTALTAASKKGNKNGVSKKSIRR
jgi:hypothetical protein